MENIVRRNEVIERLKISSTTLWRWIRAGRFPEPTRLGPNVIVWAESDLDTWISARRKNTRGDV